jgi:hypothetical protein
MTLLRPLIRGLVLAGFVAAGSLPALAGPAEISALDKYLGTWNGKGTVSGAQSQPVTCKMALSSGNGGKLNYTGRCSLGGAQLSVTGTIAYSDQNKRYEAVMNSGIGGFRGVAVGQKQGDKIVFDLHQRADDNEGNDITIAAKVVLAGTSMSVDFHAVFNDTGDKIDANVPFTKA